MTEDDKIKQELNTDTSGGIVSDYRDLQPSTTERRKPSKRLAERLPKVCTMQGWEYQLTEDDLLKIERLAAAGASLAWIGFELGCTEREMQLAVDNSSRVENALRKGIEHDLQEVWAAGRAKALEGSFQHWAAYLRNRGGSGFVDNRGDKGSGDTVAVINVNTGIDRGSAVVIDGDTQ